MKHFEERPGELWRPRYNTEQTVIVINNGYRDFVYAARNKSLKLRREAGCTFGVANNT